MEVHVSDIDGQTERLNGADGISDIEHVAIGNGAFGAKRHRRQSRDG